MSARGPLTWAVGGGRRSVTGRDRGAASVSADGDGGLQRRRTRPRRRKRGGRRAGREISPLAARLGACFARSGGRSRARCCEGVFARAGPGGLRCGSGGAIVRDGRGQALPGTDPARGETSAAGGAESHDPGRRRAGSGPVSWRRAEEEARDCGRARAARPGRGGGETEQGAHQGRWGRRSRAQGSGADDASPTCGGGAETGRAGMRTGRDREERRARRSRKGRRACSCRRGVRARRDVVDGIAPFSGFL